MSSRPRTRRRYAPRLPPEERREQLLDATLKLIVEFGHAGVSMEAVAREVGVTKPVVYGVFSDRGALMHALLEREEQRALAQIAEAVPAAAAEGTDPDVLLRTGLEAFLRAVADSPDRWRMIVLPAEGTPAVVSEHIEAGRRQIAGQLQSLVSWGLAARGGPAGLDEELVARSLLALAENAARLVLEDPERFSPERFADFGEQIVRLLPRAST